MMGASAAFAMPISYQTHLIFMARGGYRFGDFIVLGGALTLTVGLVICLLVCFVSKGLPETLKTPLPPSAPPSAPP